MKATVSQQQLAHGLSIVSRAVAPRSTLPVLANILVATDEGRLRLSATNLELGITCWIGARIEEEGSTTVPARTFTDLVSTLPNDPVSLTLNQRTQSLNVRCGASNTDIKGIDAQEFPPLPVPDPADGIMINVTDLKEMIQQVAFAASTDEARPVLMGVLIKIEKDQITLAAADGFRISERKATLSSTASQATTAIVPARALNELARVAAEGDQNVRMVMPQGRGQVIFQLKEVEVVSQLLDGNFPDYKQIIPRSYKTRTVISTAEMLKACKQAEIIARDSTNVARLNINPAGDLKPGSVEISAQAEETGNSEAVIDATIEGNPLLIAFNVRFLREVLEVIKTPNVAIETTVANSPGTIRPVGDDNFLHIIMPMHLG
jgi:DNA polymerase III subunit beta